MTRIKPTDPIPNVPFNTLSGISWPRPDAENRCFSLLVFYRGVQCSFCKTQLQSLLAWLPAFAQRNVVMPEYLVTYYSKTLATSTFWITNDC